MNRRCRILSVVFAAQVLCVGWGLSATLRIVDVQEMVSISDRVFRGRCLAVRPMTHQSGLPIVEYTFEVLEGLKGVAQGEAVVFRQLQSAGQGGFRVAGLPSYSPGQHTLLFLNADSRLGLTSPVGFSQGVFQMSRNGDGWDALNGLGNANLLYRGTHNLKAKGVADDALKRLSRPGAVPFRVLAETIRRLDRGRRHKEAGQ